LIGVFLSFLSFRHLSVVHPLAEYGRLFRLRLTISRVPVW
jgi:hypothetical protein